MNELTEGIVITLENIIDINLLTEEKTVTYLLFHAFYDILSFFTNLVNVNLYFRVIFASHEDSFTDLIRKYIWSYSVMQLILILHNLFWRSPNPGRADKKRLLDS